MLPELLPTHINSGLLFRLNHAVRNVADEENSLAGRVAIGIVDEADQCYRPQFDLLFVVKACHLQMQSRYSQFRQDGTWKMTWVLL